MALAISDSLKSAFYAIGQKLPSFKACVCFVGVPLSAGALVYYLILRKDDDVMDLIQSQYGRVEMSIPADKVGAVIGKEGCVIREIERNYKVNLKLKSADSQEPFSDEPRSLLIRGRRTDICFAEMAVRKILASTPPTLVEVITIPKASVGAIIGKNGNNIREISRFSNARLTVNSTDEEVFTLTIKGKPQAIESAKVIYLRMEEAGSPFCDPYGRWCLAGATRDNMVYCISIDSLHFDVHLWAYTPLRNTWTLMVKAASDVLASGHHYCTLAACLNENCTEAWAYLETSENTVCLFRFDLHTPSVSHVLRLLDVAPPGGEEERSVAPLGDPDNETQHGISFDNTTGPQLVAWFGHLYVCGSALQDYGSLFRVHRLDVDLISGRFSSCELIRLDLSWQSLTSAVILRVIVWQNRLAFVEPDKIRFLDFVHAQNDHGATTESLALEELRINSPASGNPAFFMLDCCPANRDRDLWLIHAFGWSRLVDAGGGISLWHDESRDDDNPVEILDCCKKCASSGFSLFWVDSENSIRTRRVGVPSLQYACIQSLIGACPAHVTATRSSETAAASLGLPQKIWNRFMGDCYNSETENAATVVTLE